MNPLLTISLVFVFLVLLIRLKVHIGYALLAATGLLLVLFATPLAALGDTFLSPRFLGSMISLTFTVLMLNVLGQLFASSGDTNRLIVALEHLLRDSRAALALIPAFIGFLPMPGGAMLSAPAVKQVGDRIGLSGHDRVIVNHWFRHVWEYIWPLYPGIILLTSFEWLNGSFASVLWVNFPLTLLAVLVGTALCLLPIGRKPVELLPGRHVGHSLLDLSRSLWPVLIVTGAAVVLGNDWIVPFLSPVLILVAVQGKLIRSRRDIIIALLFVLSFTSLAALAAVTNTDLPNLVLLLPAGLVLVLCYRSDATPLVAAFRGGFSWSMTITFVGAYVFGKAVEAAGAADAVAQSLNALDLSPWLLLFSLPFLVGLLGGATIVFVSTALPILGAAGLITLGPTLLLAYASGFMGVMLSPAHPCLVLTIEYFGSSFLPTYRRLLLAVVLFLLGAFFLTWLGWPPFRP